MSAIPRPKIVFFDVGNIFISDDPAAVFIYRRTYEAIGGAQWGTPEQFFQRRLDHMAKGGNLWSFVSECVAHLDGAKEFQRKTRHDLFSDWERYSPEIPGMHDAARRLAGQYRLGLIANQPHQVEALLRKRGIWDLFEVHGISAVVGHDKPDERLFRWALDRAGVAPAEALMVGDRIDNDVTPARRLGMRTLWLDLGFDGRPWEPEDHFAALFKESSRHHYVSTRPPREGHEHPDLVATSPDELVRVLAAL